MEAPKKEFLIKQTNQIKKQTGVLVGALLVSLLSLFVSVYQTSNEKIEEQLKELVNSQKEGILIEKEKLKYLTIQPLQTSTLKPLQKTYK